MNLDDLDQDRPGLYGEPQQAGGIPRNLQLDETVTVVVTTTVTTTGAAR